ncbi:MAG: CPBP family intramembrane glutamic endopeptidase [Planctomycetota bacterium]|nr:CPBP family intramembrane glutamic endopeptidase [Planctomycetota bacterium]
MSQNWHTTDDIESLIDPEVRAEIGDPIPISTAATAVYIPLLLLGLGLAIFWQGTISVQQFSWPRIAEDAAIGFGVGLALVAITWFLSRVLTPLQDLEREFRRVLGDVSTQRILALALLSGVAEELVFRGTLQPWIGYVATSIIFGCIHFVPSPVFLPWTLFALGAGFLFGWLFEYRDSLIAPIFAHVTVNALNLLLIVRGQRKT